MCATPIGKVSPTSSHLFKLILPLGHLQSGSKTDIKRVPPPTVFLLHPSQPLSHVSRLIIASFAPRTPTVSFRCRSPGDRYLQWADSTDVADFIRDAARVSEFQICISEGFDSFSSPNALVGNKEPEEKATVIHVEIPSFADRTRFLRRRLQMIERELNEMEQLKRTCDEEAHRGARRMALGGFGMLIVYWGAVARLTFWDYGW